MCGITGITSDGFWPSADGAARSLSAVPESEPLLTLERGVSLRALVAETEGAKWAFAEGGGPVDLLQAMTAAKGDLVCVVGGFPHGDFRSPVAELCDRVVSIAPQPLRAWTVTSEILVTWSHRAGAREPAKPSR